MKTDQLVKVLSSNVEPVPRRPVEQAIALALVVGGAVALCAMAVTLPVVDLGPSGHVPFVLVKLVFALSVAGTGAMLLVESMRPGQQGLKPRRILLIPFVAIVVAGIVEVLTSPAAEWRALVLGTQSVLCLVCIPLFAVPPFAALRWAGQKGAPTDLRYAGAIAGLVAGAVGAAAYAFACPDHALPFIAIWYSVPIALCSVAGARLGPRFLQW